MNQERRSPEAYAARLNGALAKQDWSNVEALAELMRDAWRGGNSIFVCGNGGSAVNALHWATDFLYPVAPNSRGMRIFALPANPGVVSCLANDIHFDSVFSRQLHSLAEPDDLLILLSGSGNSQNILDAAAAARELGVKTVGLFGFDGGKALGMVDVPIHFEIDDMQIAEDLQLIVNHMVMRLLVTAESSP